MKLPILQAKRNPCNGKQTNTHNKKNKHKQTKTEQIQMGNHVYVMKQQNKTKPNNHINDMQSQKNEATQQKQYYSPTKQLQQNPTNETTRIATDKKNRKNCNNNSELKIDNNKHNKNNNNNKQQKQQQKKQKTKSTTKTTSTTTTRLSS